MTVCQIVGHAIATVGHRSLTGCNLALCQRLTADGKADGSTPVIAVNVLGAGMHQKVLMTSDGKYSQELTNDPLSPIRFTIIGIVNEAQPN